MIVFTGIEGILTVFILMVVIVVVLLSTGPNHSHHHRHHRNFLSNRTHRHCGKPEVDAAEGSAASTP